MKSIRRICLILIALFLIAGISLALITRKKQQDFSRVFPDERLGILQFHMEPSFAPLPVPSLEELENISQEILLICPTQREMIGTNTRLEATVQKVFTSACGLSEGQTIWLYEPFRLFIRESGNASLLYDNSYLLPLICGKNYLVFLNRREVAEEYQYTERDLHTFFYSSMAAGAFAVDPALSGSVFRLREFLTDTQLYDNAYTKSMSESERMEYQSARRKEFPPETRLVRSLRDYAFVTTDFYGFVPDEEIS